MAPVDIDRIAIEAVLRRMHQFGSHDKCVPVEMEVDGVTYAAQKPRWVRGSYYGVPTRYFVATITKSTGAWHSDLTNISFGIPKINGGATELFVCWAADDAVTEPKAINLQIEYV